MSAARDRAARRAELLARCEDERQELRILRAQTLALVPRARNFSGLLRTVLRIARLLSRP